MNQSVFMSFSSRSLRRRYNLADGLSNDEAVDKAVQRCINEGILKDYLLKKRAEAVRMLLTEFDEDVWRQSMNEEGREEGEVANRCLAWFSFKPIK